MAILKNQEVYFCKLNPARPDKNKLNPDKPNWNLQCRTTDKDQRKAWKDMGFNPRVVREDPSDEESKILYYSINLRKNATKMDGTVVVKNNPPEVVNGKNEPIDGSTIGNGSICNIRLFRRDYEVGGIKKVGYTLMGVQVVKHKVYVAAPMEEFDECETEVIMPDVVSSDDKDEDLY